MNGYDRMKETSRDLEPNLPKESMSMLRQICEDKIREAREASLQVKGSMKGSLNVESYTASSETYELKMKARLDSLGEQLSNLGRSLKHIVTPYYLSRVKRIGEEIEIFDREHSSFIYDNCKVDPVIMDVQDQLGSLRKEYKEKRAAILKTRLGFLGEQLSELGDSRQSGAARSSYVKRIGMIEKEIEIFDKEHSSYVYDNCKVDPAMMDVLRQLESLRKEYKEKKATMLKARLEILWKRLSDLDRSHPSSSDRLHNLGTMEGLEGDVERFGRKHSSYISDNCEVDPAMMDVRDQLESLRKACQEKRTVVMKATLDCLREELSDLDRSHQSSSDESYNLIIMKKLEEDVERFGKEYSYYVKHNYEVDPGLIDVQDQLESLRKECQEKRVVVMKAKLDVFEKRLSDLDRSHQSSPDELRNLITMKKLESDVEGFGERYYYYIDYIKRNCEVDPGLMDVRDQLELLRKECQEKKATMLKAKLDVFEKRLSDLDRSHQSSPDGLRDLRTMENLERDIEKLDDEHSYYIERNYEAYPALMDVGDQLESLRKECQEKRTAMLEEQVDSFTKQLDVLKKSLFNPSKLYNPTRDRLYPVLHDWHEQIQNAKLENSKTHKVLENIERLRREREKKFSNLKRAISEFHNKYYNFIINSRYEDRIVKYVSMIEDAKLCFNRLESDENIINTVWSFQKSLKRKVQAIEKCQSKEQGESFGLDQLYREE